MLIRPKRLVLIEGVNIWKILVAFVAVVMNLGVPLVLLHLFLCSEGSCTVRIRAFDALDRFKGYRHSGRATTSDTESV